ncbi:MAG: toll/interleukin-1 receptor domain-containing protein [Candidatus Brocadiaceae bacterium]|nr:toll/interleukin-1 receptor domain-containing protein [Candidatus Brocadiaceae bacterium]
MAFVPHYKNDIFISYAHVDNQPLPSVEEGWVTTFVKGLTTLLNQKLGRDDAYKLWIDHELSRHVKITPQIMDTLRDTAVIIVILSPGYVESEWCQKEKDTFLKLIRERVSSGSRVFIVEHDIVDESHRPEQFRELLGYRFWVKDREGKPPRLLGLPKPDPTDQRYYDLLNDISSDLKKELQRLKELEKSSGKIKKVSDKTTAVFLAEVTDDLEPQRDNVKRYLDQHNVRILPETLYPREPSEFQEALKNDIAKSVLFVQLLSGIEGKRPPGLSTSYTLLQYDQAVQSKLPILQWRSRDLDISKVLNTEYQTFLRTEAIMAIGIEEFKRTIVERAFFKPPSAQKKSTHTFMFVNTGANDRLIADNICQFLDHQDAEYVLPLVEGRPKDIREDLERNLLECDGVIIVYGNITVTWVREQLRQCRKILAKRERPLKALAVYEGPPEKKVPLDLKLQNMCILDCRKGLKENELVSFFESLK